MIQVRSRGKTTLRAGVTLIEMLVVVTIIIILSALVLGGYSAVNRKRAEMEANEEIRKLSDALEAFKRDRGVYPPSRVYLLESGDYTTSGGGINVEIRDRSAEFLGRIWPGLRIRSIRTPGATPTATDWNGDGDTTDSLELTGEQCLVFFLGGIPRRLGGGGADFELVGFSNADSNPAAIHSTTNDAQGLMQRKIYYNFGASTGSNTRLTLREARIGGAGAPGPNDMMPVYTAGGHSGDSLAAYAYFSSYEGRGYRADDCGTVGASGPIFAVTWGVTTTTVQKSAGPSPYTADAVTTGTLSNFLRPDSYQLISPGLDGLIGEGGAVPVSVEADRDNYTNFSSKKVGLIEGPKDASLAGGSTRK